MSELAPASSEKTIASPDSTHPQDATPILALSDPRRRNRIDWVALLDRRALVLLPAVVLALSLPFVIRALHPYWIGLDGIPLMRLFGRFGCFLVFLGYYPVVLILTRIGISKLSTQQHRAVLYLYPVLASAWQFALGLDAFLLIAWPERFALPSLWLDFAISLGSVAMGQPLLWYSQTWFYGFEPELLRRSRVVLESAGAYQEVRHPIDTLDYRVLQLVAASGGRSIVVMINDIGIGRRDMLLRLRKLCALGYVNLVDEMHGPQLTLTTLATDTLALPVSLFSWESNDAELLHDLATARMALESEEPQKVVVVCARCCERLLRGLLAARCSDVTHSGSKAIDKATLGDLIGTCRQQRIISRFEDNIFSAINERRKKIHALEDEGTLNEFDAFILYTLTEIAARSLLNTTR